MNRRDWWLGVSVVALALLIHSMLPRYEVVGYGDAFLRVDRWTGVVEHPVAGDNGATMIWQRIQNPR